MGKFIPDVEKSKTLKPNEEVGIYIQDDGMKLSYYKFSYRAGGIGFTCAEPGKYNGYGHRDDGPASIYHAFEEGDCDEVIYHRYGQKHRIDGPARVTHKGVKQYYLFGEKMSKKKWAEQVKYLAFK